MEIFLGGLVLISHTSKAPAITQILCHEKRYAQTKPWIYRWQNVKFFHQHYTELSSLDHIQPLPICLNYGQLLVCQFVFYWKSQNKLKV